MKNEKLRGKNETGLGQGIVSAGVATDILTKWERKYSCKFPETYINHALQELLRQHGNEINAPRSLFSRFMSPRQEPEKVKQTLVKVGESRPSDQKYVVVKEVPGSKNTQVVVYPVYAPALDEDQQVVVPDYLDRAVQRFAIFEWKTYKFESGSVENYATRIHNKMGRLVSDNPLVAQKLLSDWLTGEKTC